MNANDRQVDGDHYKSAAFQPWDWERYGVGYLECNVIKYVTRYQNKTGVTDLQKALHYIDKLIEEYMFHNRVNRMECERKRQNYLMLAYADAWKLSLNQHSAIGWMLTWEDPSDLRLAKAEIQVLIDAYTTSDVRSSDSVDETATAGAVVPLE
jgi:hypothetical protein